MNLAISPDGRSIVYPAERDDTQQLYLHHLDEFVAGPIAGTEGASGFSFFSPDGESLGFFADGKVQKVSLQGGLPTTLCLAESSWRGGTWVEETIVFSAGHQLYRVPATGGEPESLAIPDKDRGELRYTCPRPVPGGKAVFFDARIEGSPLQIRLLLLETGQQKIVVNDGANANYAPTGHLVYHQSRTSLVAAPFDLTRLEVTGDSVSVLEEVLGVGYTFSNDGTLIYIPSVTLSEPPEDTLIWVDRKGMQQEVIDKKFIGRVRQLSPDRRRIATVQREDGESHIWIYDLEDGLFRRLTFEGEVNDGPAWTPDGKWIAFRSNRDGPFNLYRKLADGSRPVERLTTSEFSQSPASWSPDGSVLVFRQRSTNGKNMSIWVLPMKGGRKPRAFITPSDPVWNLNFSPDGRWLAYLTNSSKAGRTNGVHLYVRPYPGPDVKWLISGEDAGGPVWSPDGTELFYRSVPHHPLRPQDLTKIMGVSIQTQPSFRAGKPRLLFEGLYEGIMGLSPDGHRFLMSKRSTRESPRQGINVVLNWFEELKRKVPTDN